MLLEPQSALIRPSTNSDSWGRYYTSNFVSNVLVNTMGCISPKVIVELGSGKGSIALEAAKRWNASKFITVDMDPLAITQLNGLKNVKNHTHHIQDALDDSLAERIGLNFGSADVGLCNPPFVRPKWRASFGNILEQAGLSGSLNSIADAGADILFIAQNLRLLRKFGKLGLILPDGLITGEKYKGVRSVLMKDHFLEQVIQLPRRVFTNTEAQAYLLVLSKDYGETQSIVLKSMSGNGQLSSPINVTPDEAKRRLDYSFHLLKKNEKEKIGLKKGHISIGDITQSLVRGSLCSNQLESIDLPVFHLGDFPSRAHGQMDSSVPSKFIQSRKKLKSLPHNIKIAEKGDILLARIGRNLQDKVCSVKQTGCVISDCVYALRVAPSYRELVISYLNSEIGKQAIAASSHGVGAKYLARSDLLSLKLPI